MRVNAGPAPASTAPRDVLVRSAPPSALQHLQSTAGNAAVSAMLQRHASGNRRIPAQPAAAWHAAAGPAPVQRCGGEVHDGCSCAADQTDGGSTDGFAVQRDGPFGAARDAFNSTIHRAALEPIQGAPMYDLLPKLLAQPADVRADEEAGRAVGGPRLVAAMRAVAAKGSPWEGFVATNNAVLIPLPPDQIGDIVAFLGGPKDYRYYKADQILGKEFGGHFDGSVDPVAGVVTLYFRAKFEMEGVRWGLASPGTPEWEREAVAGRAKFEADFKRVVESTWSFKGKVKPGCAIGPIPAFTTKVVVTVVDSGEHTVFHVFSAGADGRSNAAPGTGNLKAADNAESTHTDQVSDPTGKRPEQVTVTQAPSAHEFGHALGLQHPHCPGGDDVCYGVTADERQDIMGAGNMLQVIRRGGKVVHDDFGPFEAIAKTWGQERLTGALSQCNTWSAA